MLQIDIVSDVVCPWCYIGKRRLEKAIAASSDIPVDVRWRPFLLDPTLPPEGRERKEYLERKLGGPERVKAVLDQIAKAGESEGLTLDFDAIKVSPNTVDAHCLIRWSSNVDAQDAVVEALFRAFFVDGKNIGDHNVLVEIAKACGMDVDVVWDLLSKGADREHVMQEIALVQSSGVNGVPCFILGNRQAVAGAQEPEALARVMRAVHDDLQAASA